MYWHSFPHVRVHLQPQKLELTSVEQHNYEQTDKTENNTL